MLTHKVKPVAFKFFQLLLNYNIAKYLSPHKNRPQITVFQSRVYIISAGLAFLWPVKKAKKEILENKAEYETIIQNADNLFDGGHYEECYKLLSSCQDPNVEISWRLSRVLYNMAKEPKYDKAYKKELTLKGFEIISQVIRNNPEHYAVQKWYALMLDAKCTYDGIKERIRQLENIKKHMDLAVTLNPNDATTLHMLGEWCYQVSELPWHQRKIAEALFASPPQSTYEDALEYFLRAESVEPRFYSINLLRIGNCYIQLKKEDQAKYYLQLAASYPAKSNDDHRANKEAAELLTKLK